MGNKFDFETANDLCELLKTAAETMESENQKYKTILLHYTKLLRIRRMMNFKAILMQLTELCQK